MRVRHLPPESAVAAIHGETWTLAHDIADLARREALAVAGVEKPQAHPTNPAIQHEALVERIEARVRDRKVAEAKRRAADHAARIEAQRLYEAQQGR